MSKKRDSVAVRLRKLIEEEKQRKKASFLAELFCPPVLDPILQRARNLAAAVQLKPNEVELKKAFKQFDLDPEVPDHWHKLITYLARSHFEIKPAGAPKQWTFERRRQLLRDLRTAAKKSGRSDLKELCAIMRTDPVFQSRYKLTDSALRKQIRMTLDWASPYYYDWLSRKGRT